MASPQAEAVKAQLRQFAESLDPNAELDQMRASYETFTTLTTEPAGVRWTEVDAGGVPAIWADPTGGAQDRVLQYVHGGGYVIGSASYYRKLTGHLANALGCRVLNVDYRLAPEHPHPAPVEDSTTAYRWLLDQGIEPGHIAISGDSAGGGLTVATLLSIRDAGLPMPAAAMPLSPWVDMEGTGDSMTSRRDRDVLVQAEVIKGMADAFLQGQNARDPLAAPLHADLSRLCPLYIQVGDDETLLDDSVRLADRARAAGVDVRLDVFPEMQHVFQMAAGTMPEADEAIARLAAWVRPLLGLA
jgi:monoterpene epsilon-lactone hydrolase